MEQKIEILSTILYFQSPPPPPNCWKKATRQQPWHRKLKTHLWTCIIRMKLIKIDVFFFGLWLSYTLMKQELDWYSLTLVKDDETLSNVLPTVTCFLFFFFMHPNQNVRVSSYEAISCHSTWSIWLYTNIFVLLYRLRGVKRFSNKLCLESRDFTKRKEKDQDQTSLPKDLGYSLLQFSYLGVVCFVQSGHWRRAGDFSWRGCRRSAQFFLWSV